MINMNQVESNLYLEGDRRQLFASLGVPSHQVNNYIFRKEMITDSQDNIKTIQTIRHFITLPKWLKKRMKYRLRHPQKDIDFTAMVNHLLN